MTVAAGFYVSSGSFVVLIDSDSVVDEKAIEEFMKTFSANPKVGGMVGNCKVLNADRNFLTRCQDSSDLELRDSSSSYTIKGIDNKPELERIRNGTWSDDEFVDYATSSA